MRLSTGEAIVACRGRLGADVTLEETLSKKFLFFLCLADFRSVLNYSNQFGHTAPTLLTNTFIQPILQFLSLFLVGYARPVFSAVSYVDFVWHALQLDTATAGSIWSGRHEHNIAELRWQ